MLISAISDYSKNPTLTIIGILLMIPSLLIALTVHEYSHGRIALALGDKTALMAGRLTLNPIRHFDLIGSLMLLVFGFGYAKPVPINPRNFDKVKYKTGIILVSLAGPLSNLILTFIGVLGHHVTRTLAYHLGGSMTVYSVVAMFFEYFAIINTGLLIFNLIPLPPLDGSRILTVFLPVKAQMWFFKYERYIQLAIFALLWFGVLDTPLLALRSWILGGMDKIVSLIPFLM